MAISLEWSIAYLVGSTLTVDLHPYSALGTVANTGGDDLVEGANGLFVATVEEALTGLHKCYAKRNGVPVVEDDVYLIPDTTCRVGAPLAALTAYDPPTKAELDAAIAGLGGTGARTVTITVNDGATALQAATVRVTQGAETYTQATNASGVATFNLDDATWTVGITKANYSFSGASLVVDGNEAVTYSMTAVVVTPPTNPALSAIEVLCLDSAGAVEAGVTVDIRIISIPSGSQNIAFKGAKQTATSDVNGIARFEVVQGSTCEWKRGLADVWQRVSIDADGVTNVTSVIGSP